MVAKRMSKPVKLHSVITCPECGHKERETMPIDSCQWLYECNECGEMLQPRPGDCCVFCSYGSFPCPTVQQERDGREIV